MSRPSSRSLEHARTLLSDSDRGVRSAGIQALGQLASQQAFDLLLAVPDSEDVPALAAALIACSKNVSDITRFLDRIEGWLSGRAVHRANAFDGLEALGPRALRFKAKLHKTFQAKLKGGTSDDLWVAIRAAASLYAMTGDVQYRDYLVKGLGNRADVRVRSCAALALQGLGEAERPLLESLVVEGNQLQRQGARAVLDWLERPIGRAGQKKVPRKRAKQSLPAKKAATPAKKLVKRRATGSTA